MKKKILIASGGSGGHIIPATIFYDFLKDNFQPIISSDKRGINYLDKKKYDLKIIDTPQIFEKKIYLIFKLFLIFALIIKSIIFLKNEKIQKIISTGGYSPIPLCIAGLLLRIDLYIYEPNLVIGKSNKLFLSKCEKIFVHSKKVKNFPYDLKKKTILISPLVRQKFYQKKRKKNELFKIIIIGGSQGANKFDYLFHDIFYKISKKIKLEIIHQTKKDNISFLKNFYNKNNIKNNIFSFKKNILNLLYNCDFCITRAGASTLGELLILKIPFLTIPLPSSADNHQYENGKHFLKLGCCWMLTENQISKIRLYNFLKKIIIDRKNLIKKNNNIIKLNKNISLNSQKKIILETINEN